MTLKKRIILEVPFQPYQDGYIHRFDHDDKPYEVLLYKYKGSWTAVLSGGQANLTCRSATQKGTLEILCTTSAIMKQERNFWFKAKHGYEYGELPF